MDVVFLSRIQFALTIMFHYLFPPLTIGIGVVLVYLEGKYFFTDKKIYHQAAKFWTKIFALNFGVGVASGIVMEFEFGTNWSNYSRFVGDVFGSALAAEGIFAFFLESGFLAVLVFGWDRVSKGVHFFSTCMVSLGSIFSSIWIVVANSWQQTPAGHKIVSLLRDGKPLYVDGQPVFRAEIIDFWGLVFNPSSVIRLFHVLIGCFIVGSFFIMSISAWYLLKNKYRDFAERSFEGALYFAFFSTLLAAFSGHIQANTVYRYQPAKLAAFEGHFRTERGDLTLFGIPNETTERVDYQIAIPGLLSFLVHEDFTSEVIGLDKFKKEDRPPLMIPFISYRIMVGTGMFFLALTGLSLILLCQRKLFDNRLILTIFLFSIIPAIAANHSGWVAAEVGRQPWIVHPPVQYDTTGKLVTGASGFYEYDEQQGLRTVKGVSSSIDAGEVIFSLVFFTLLYGLLFFVWIYILNSKIKHGPDTDEDGGKKDDFIKVATQRVDHKSSLTR